MVNVAENRPVAGAGKPNASPPNRLMPGGLKSSFLLLFLLISSITIILSISSSSSPFAGRPPALVAGGIFNVSQPIDLDALRGNVVLLYFWTTTCPSCRGWDPVLNELQDAYAGEGLLVVGVTDEAASQVAPFVAEAPDDHGGKRFPVAVDALMTFVRYDAVATPRFVIIGRDGEVKYNGAVYTGWGLRREVKQALQDASERTPTTDVAALIELGAAYGIDVDAFRQTEQRRPSAFRAYDGRAYRAFSRRELSNMDRLHALQRRSVSAPEEFLEVVQRLDVFYAKNLPQARWEGSERVRIETTRAIPRLYQRAHSEETINRLVDLLVGRIERIPDMESSRQVEDALLDALESILGVSRRFNPVLTNRMPMPRVAQAIRDLASRTERKAMVPRLNRLAIEYGRGQRLAPNEFVENGNVITLEQADIANGNFNDAFDRIRFRWSKTIPADDPLSVWQRFAHYEFQLRRPQGYDDTPYRFRGVGISQAMADFAESYERILRADAITKDLIDDLVDSKATLNTHGVAEMCARHYYLTLLIEVRRWITLSETVRDVIDANIVEAMSLPALKDIEFDRHVLKMLLNIDWESMSLENRSRLRAILSQHSKQSQRVFQIEYAALDEALKGR